LLVTVPEPAPVFETDRFLNNGENVAVTFLAVDIVTRHVPVPVQAPLQPAKVELKSGVAVSVTTVPEI